MGVLKLEVIMECNSKNGSESEGNGLGLGREMESKKMNLVSCDKIQVYMNGKF